MIPLDARSFAQSLFWHIGYCSPEANVLSKVISYHLCSHCMISGFGALVILIPLASASYSHWSRWKKFCSVPLPLYMILSSRVSLFPEYRAEILSVMLMFSAFPVVLLIW